MSVIRLLAGSPRARLAQVGLLALFAAALLAPGLAPGHPATLARAGSANDACVSQAVEVQHASAWVCLGGTLSYNAGTKAAPHWKVREVPRVTASLKPVSDDTWCETSGRCARLIGPSADGNYYSAEVKGNAAFGDINGVLGTFDVVWRSSLNGPRPRWRLHLIWDSGHAVVSDVWEAWTREENSLSPDGYFCFADFQPDNISSASWSAWSPSSTTYRNCSDSIDKTETWHDDLSGRFESWGQTYVAGTLHSAHWKSWKKSDGTYDAKMTSAWDY